MHKGEAKLLEGSMCDNGRVRANMSEATLAASRDKQGPKQAIDKPEQNRDLKEK